ncbi:MAG: hypothetical protein VYD39_01310 [Bacteroidota bacterium]|nr:hypothetical protein [Bacteroidota bacterium]
MGPIYREKKNVEWHSNDAKQEGLSWTPSDNDQCSQLWLLPGFNGTKHYDAKEAHQRRIAIGKAMAKASLFSRANKENLKTLCRYYRSATQNHHLDLDYAVLGLWLEHEHYRSLLPKGTTQPISNQLKQAVINSIALSHLAIMSRQQRASSATAKPFVCAKFSYQTHAIPSGSIHAPSSREEGASPTDIWACVSFDEGERSMHEVYQTQLKEDIHKLIEELTQPHITRDDQPHRGVKGLSWLCWLGLWLSDNSAQITDVETTISSIVDQDHTMIALRSAINHALKINHMITHQTLHDHMVIMRKAMIHVGSQQTLGASIELALNTLKAYKVWLNRLMINGSRSKRFSRLDNSWLAWLATNIHEYFRQQVDMLIGLTAHGGEISINLPRAQGEIIPWNRIAACWSKIAPCRWENPNISKLSHQLYCLHYQWVYGELSRQVMKAKQQAVINEIRAWVNRGFIQYQRFYLGSAQVDGESKSDLTVDLDAMQLPWLWFKDESCATHAHIMLEPVDEKQTHSACQWAYKHYGTHMSHLCIFQDLSGTKVVLKQI